MRNYISALFITFFILAGCAKISSPSGGPKDVDPPVLVESDPPSGTKNFTGREIIITFDEYVVLDNINEKFMVSPPLTGRPETLIRGKSIRVRFDEDLKDSTTYSFYFQDAIRDLNERNPIDNYQFVFSTGPVIDSLSVTGNVYNALNLDIPENTLVMLYRQLDDSSVVKSLPDYITRVGSTGSFRIDNISKGIYRLYALKDIDNSKNFNLADEEFAFMDETVEVTPERNYLSVPTDSTAIKLPEGATSDSLAGSGMYSLILFPSEKKTRYLTSSDRKLPYQMTFTLSLPPDTMDFKFLIPGAEEGSFYIEKSLNSDTITVWLTDSTLYTREMLQALVTFPFTDSLGNDGYRTDTITGRFLKPRQTRGSAARQQYRISSDVMTGSVKPGRRIRFISPSPLMPPDTSKLRIYELIEESRIRIPYTLVKDTLRSCNYFMDISLQQGKSYLYIADSAAFRNIYGESSDSTGARFNVRTPESYGQLKLNIMNFTGDRIIQLLDRQEKVIKEVRMKEDGVIEFPLLEKGFYRIRAIYDLNGDGKWTTGDFKTRRQPEPASYYPEELEVKVNWQLTQDWDLGRLNYKDSRLKGPKGTARGVSRTTF